MTTMPVLSCELQRPRIDVCLQAGLAYRQMLQQQWLTARQTLPCKRKVQGAFTHGTANGTCLSS